MPFFAGSMKRKNFEFMEDSDHSELEHSKAKRHQSRSLFYIAKDQHLSYDWTGKVLNFHRPNPPESHMDTGLNALNPKITLEFTNEQHSCFHNTQIGPHQASKPLQSGNLSIEHEDKMASPMSTSNNLFYQVQNDVQRGKQMINRQHPRESDNSKFLTGVPHHAAQRCPECAAGKSGHIHHTGRWRLLDQY